MKIRTDFVTNSSSSSFIMGVPNGHTVTTKDVKTYLKNALNMTGAGDSVYCEHMVDLRYDPNKKYDNSEIELILEAISWYLEDDEDETEDKVAIDPEDHIDWYIDNAGAYHEIRMYSDEERSTEEIKHILDFAYKYLGEVLAGSIELPFRPYEVYDVIKEDDSIKFKCNHMG